MKVIFLDVDGVLVHSGTLQRGKDHSLRSHRAKAQIDMDCARRLASIVDQTGAEIVVSSIWRMTENLVVGLEWGI